MLELMIVVAIMGILAGVAVPSAVSYLPTYRLNQAAREVKADLELAKITGVRRSTRCVVHFSPGAYTPEGQVGSYSIFLDTNCDWDELNAGGTPEKVVLPIRNMPGGVSLYQANFCDNGCGQPDATLMAGFRHPRSGGAFDQRFVCVRRCSASEQRQ